MLCVVFLLQGNRGVLGFWVAFVVRGGPEAFSVSTESTKTSIC